MPTDDVFGLAPGALVLPVDPSQPTPRRASVSSRGGRASDRAKHLPVGERCWAVWSMVPAGHSMASARSSPVHSRSLQSRPINPLQREPIRYSMDVGIRAINGLLTVGRGQRVGLFAGSGVGKSVLIGMMARYTAADVVVVGLIGEQGREVKEFIEQNLGEDGLVRSVVVAAPADTSPLMRLQAAAYATTVAEYFRDQGKQVLLIMDSLTRYAMAQREIALAIGEPPVTRGYPPSVFAACRRWSSAPAMAPKAAARSPRSTRCWPKATTSRIRSPIPRGPSSMATSCFRARSPIRALPGDRHRTVDQPGHAQSREEPALRRRAPLQTALFALPALARPDFGGAYKAGSDPVLDQAVALYPRLEGFLQQRIDEREGCDESVLKLAALFNA